jgi:hypothetical protein
MRQVFILLMLLLSIRLYSQSENAYNICYKPNKHYEFNSESYTRTITSLEGDESIIENLNRASLYPMEYSFLSVSEEFAETGASKIEGTVPIKYSFIKGQTKTRIRNKTITEKSPFNGMSVEGYYIDESKFVPNPNCLDGLSDSIKQSIFKSVSESQNQILFPAERLKIGDKFTRNKSVQIPVSGLKPINCIVSTEFTLVDTTSRVTHFSINQNIKQDSSKSNASIDFNGVGSGDILFDKENSFIISQIINNAISVKFKSNNLYVIINQNNSLNQKVKIE